jgi:uncharacterized protein DUF5654
MVQLSEVKVSIATAIAAAFGFVIALIWKDIIIGLMKLAGLWQEGGPTDGTSAIIAIVGAIIITLVCVLGIMYISKWGGIQKK